MKGNQFKYWLYEKMNNILLALKGAIFGIANIIPGVSGGTIALTMGVYEDLISSISHFFKNPKQSLKFLIPFAIGAVLSILLMSKLISLCLEKFPFPTTLFFVGLIMGGIPLLTKKVKNSKPTISNIFLFLLTFTIVLVMNFVKTSSSEVSLATINFGTMILLLVVGLVASATMVIPGISGSFVLMLLGYYKPIVNTVSALTDFSKLGHNLTILIPFGIGVLLGIILISKLLEYLFNKYEIPTYYAILGFVISSILTLLLSVISPEVAIVQVLIGVVLLVVASLIGYKLGDE